MDTEKLSQIADTIEQNNGPLIFDMGCYREERVCGTAACIAGYTIAIFKPDEWKKDSDHILYNQTAARKELELTDEEAEDLFLGDYPCTFLVKITAREAVNTLRYAVMHKKIDWIRANPQWDETLCEEWKKMKEFSKSYFRHLA